MSTPAFTTRHHTKTTTILQNPFKNKEFRLQKIEVF